jgi:Flp pilus assembly protein TadD
VDIDTDRVQLLMEIGYLAGGHGYPAESETIFEGIRAMRPQSELPVIGLAVAKMNAGHHQEAARILWEEALAINPESDLARSFLGLVLKLSGLQSESRTILEEVVAADRQPEAVNMAKSLLEEMTA